MTARLVTLIMLLTLSGCGKIPFPWKPDKDNTEPPTPLVKFTPSLQIDTLWSRDIGAGASKLYLKLTPTVAGQRIFLADNDGKVSAIDTETGSTLWRTNTNKPITGGPGHGEGLVLIGTSDGEVLALSDDDGRLLWTSQVSSEILATPQAASDIVVVRTIDGKLFGLNAADGTRRWTYDRSVPILTLRGTSAPSLYEDKAIAGFDSGKLVAVELTTGKLLWESRIATPRGRTELERMVDIDAEPLIVDRFVYVATFQGRVAAVALDSGQVLWTRDLSSYAGISADADNLYITDANGQVYALNRLSGRSIWKQDKLRARSVTAPATIGPYVVVGDFDGYLHWMRTSDGRFVARTRLEKSAIIAPPIITNKVLYSYGSRGTIAAYRYQ